MNNLKAARKMFSFSQQKIADLLGIEQTHYSKYELEKHILPIDRYKQLATFYNLSIDYLCGLTNEPRTLTGISVADNIYIIKRAGK